MPECVFARNRVVLVTIMDPLIVTGTVLFTNRSTSGFVQRDQEIFDSLGRRRVVPVRTYMERKGFVLRPKFVFIDGRTGARLVDPGNLVHATDNTALVTITQVRPIRVNFTLAERDLSLVRKAYITKPPAVVRVN